MTTKQPIANQRFKSILCSFHFSGIIILYTKSTTIKIIKTKTITMRNLFVSPVLAFGLLVGTQNMNAQEVASNDDTEITIPTQEKYIDLAIENLPQPVLDAVAKDYAGATIEKAAAKEDASEFKLVIKQGEKEMEVFCDAEGKWISKK